MYAHVCICIWIYTYYIYTHSCSGFLVGLCRSSREEAPARAHCAQPLVALAPATHAKIPTESPSIASTLRDSAPNGTLEHLADQLKTMWRVLQTDCKLIRS